MPPRKVGARQEGLSIGHSTLTPLHDRREARTSPKAGPRSSARATSSTERPQSAAYFAPATSERMGEASMKTPSASVFHKKRGALRPQRAARASRMFLAPPAAGSAGVLLSAPARATLPAAASERRPRAAITKSGS